MPPKSYPSKSASPSKKKFQPKDLVFAKMSGFKPWPAFIIPLNLVPKNVSKSKKKSTEYCVIFIPEGNYGWIQEKNLTELTPELLNSELSKIPKDILKQDNLRYWTRTPTIKESIAATKGLTYEKFMKFTADKFKDGKGGDDDDDDEEGDEEEEEIAEEEVEEEEPLPQKKPKKGRSSSKDDENDADGEDDEEEDDDHDQEEESVSEIKPAKRKPNKATLTKNGKAIPSTSSSSSTSSTTSKRVKRELEDDSTPISKKKKLNGSSPSHIKLKNESPKPVSEDEKRHQLWLCRIKLQRTLIQRNQPTTPKDTSKLTPLTADELSIARLILYRLLDFPISIDLLRKTKIHKVLKCIIKDESLKYSDSFKLHERCQEVLSKWDSEIQTLKLEKSARELNNLNAGGGSGSGGNATSGISSIRGSPTNGAKNGDDKFKLKISQVAAAQAGDDSEISGLDHSITDKKDEDDDEESNSNEEEQNNKTSLPSKSSISSIGV
ncbi:vesicle coat complex AP-3 [Scheffersomyces coipomensis]|uniref:vesicle coat complex AP-3 n=1 Tax=Scheffersomyces coipomensis TaxID=1788519 RepID=UPI00315CB7E1